MGDCVSILKINDETAAYTPSPVAQTDSCRDIARDEGVDDEGQRRDPVDESSPLDRGYIGDQQTEHCRPKNRQFKVSACGEYDLFSYSQKSMPVAPEAKMTIPTQTALTVELAAMMMAPIV